MPPVHIDADLPPKTACRIYGHGHTRWLPLVGPPPLPMAREDRPRVLVCLFCTTIVDVPRETSPLVEGEPHAQG